mmetsp:Transcript_89723/g.256450  ORF Transcript_89723/g.256450 Transcript_89723/m.256450 type:complete len:130 (-) Transcript_89723:254-643(-)
MRAEKEAEKERKVRERESAKKVREVQKRSLTVYAFKDGADDVPSLGRAESPRYKGMDPNGFNGLNGSPSKRGGSPSKRKQAKASPTSSPGASLGAESPTTSPLIKRKSDGSAAKAAASVSSATKRARKL